MAETIDRRRFLAATGVAGAATGALWVAPSVLGSSNAFAAGSCLLQDQINWGAFDDQFFDMSSGGTFSITPSRTTGPGVPDYQVTVTVTPKGTVAARRAATSLGHAFGNQPAVYLLQMQGDGTSTDFGYDITFSWPTGHHAYRLNYSIAVVDDGPGTPPSDYVDNVYTNRPFSGADPGTTYYPSRISGTGTPVDPWLGHAGVQPVNSTVSNILVGYADTTETSSITISYRGDDTRQGGLQAIGIANLTWCQ